jgi:transposase
MLNQIVADSGTATESRTLRFGITIWFKERVKHNGGRLKKQTIVALARKLLVAIWKHVNAGVVIEGAALKTA